MPLVFWCKALCNLFEKCYIKFILLLLLILYLQNWANRPETLWWISSTIGNRKILMLGWTVSACKTACNYIGNQIYGMDLAKEWTTWSLLVWVSFESACAFQSGWKKTWVVLSQTHFDMWTGWCGDQTANQCMQQSTHWDAITPVWK